jgi:FtsP/CotA-like multicopper oxidase with cupredoxin domain
MSRSTRLGLLAVALVILVVAFLALRPSAEDAETTADAPTATPTLADTATPAPGATETPTPKPTFDPGPLLTGSKVVKIRVDKGDTVRFRVRSPQDEEVHIHGYDIKKDVTAGQTAKVSFKATIDGIFEIEFEGAAKQIAELRVDP